MIQTLIALAIIFSQLSVLAFGCLLYTSDAADE